MSRYEAIKKALSHPTSDSLRRLFGQELAWSIEQGSQPLQVGRPIHQTVTLEAIASAAGVRIYRLARQKLPTLTERRAIMRALLSFAAEHIVVYCATGEVAFVWANRRHDSTERSVIELRTLTYTADEPARTTIEQLAELALPSTVSQLDPAFSSASPPPSASKRSLSGSSRITRKSSPTCKSGCTKFQVTGSGRMTTPCSSSTA